MHFPSHEPKNISGVKGITLIEVLATLLVLSVGLLGIARLQSVSVHATTNASFQTHAMMLTQDLIERITANREAVLTGTGAVSLGNYAKVAGTDFPAATVASCYTSSGCSSDQMATSDMVQWSTMLGRVLPITTDQLTNNVVVCVDSTPATAACDDTGNTVKITFLWNESGTLERQSGSTQSYTVSFEP